MPLDTLDRSPPPFFKQGPSSLSRLLLLAALALFLMVADARFHLVQPLRATIATVLYPAQWLALQPVQWAREFGGYLTDLKTARKTEEAARQKLVEQSLRAGQVELLLQENARLRELLQLRARIEAQAQAAEVLYDATDPYSRRVVIDKGQLQGIALGSPVLDESGVLGQITRVYPFVSEITLLIDRDQVIPVVNTRTGVRSVAHGDPTEGSGGLEMRYMSAPEDVEPGDLLATSGIDGVYPPGLPVARVASVDRRGDTSFMRVRAEPLAQLQGVRHVMVLAPVAAAEGMAPEAAGVEPTAPAGVQARGARP
jgi:rod shape-determining protein MreC